MSESMSRRHGLPSCYLLPPPAQCVRRVLVLAYGRGDPAPSRPLADGSILLYLGRALDKPRMALADPLRGSFFTQLSFRVSDMSCMTLPRQVVPGHGYMITRRCSERRCFLRSDDDTNDALIYCLGLAAIRANVQVKFSVAMSNHYWGCHAFLSECPPRRGF